MRLRRVQMDLERVWIAQKRWKTDSSEQSANRQEQHSMRLTSILRLEMAFFADGLMRYAQVPAAPPTGCPNRLAGISSFHPVGCRRG